MEEKNNEMLPVQESKYSTALVTHKKDTANLKEFTLVKESQTFAITSAKKLECIPPAQQELILVYNHFIERMNAPRSNWSEVCHLNQTIQENSSPICPIAPISQLSRLVILIWNILISIFPFIPAFQMTNMICKKHQIPKNKKLMILVANYSITLIGSFSLDSSLFPIVCFLHLISLFIIK
jgi:hypothetical protein